jgi:DNA-binding beta-propeller fold protein YncE
MTDLKKCKIIDTIENIKRPRGIIQTPCGTFLIITEGSSLIKYCLETKQKIRITGGVNRWGHQDGTRDESIFNCPQGLTLSKDLKTLFVVDRCNCVIRAICVQTGITTTFAGKVGVQQHVDGPKEKACFKLLITLKLSPDCKTLIVPDYNKLRTICIATAQVDTIDTFGTFYNNINDFVLSPDGKHIYICNGYNILKYNLEKTRKSEIVLEEDQGVLGCDISKNGQFMFIVNEYKHIKVVNLATDEVINTITITFKPPRMSISTNGKQLYICDDQNNKIQVLDISKYCTNFKIFLKSQLTKYSFLPRAVVKRISI